MELIELGFGLELNLYMKIYIWKYTIIKVLIRLLI